MVKPLIENVDLTEIEEEIVELMNREINFYKSAGKLERFLSENSIAQ